MGDRWVSIFERIVGEIEESDIGHSGGLVLELSKAGQMGLRRQQTTKTLF
jgi:hypothetical protein